MLQADLASGAYDPSRTPAYVPVSSPKHDDDDISPCDTVPSPSPLQNTANTSQEQGVSVQQGTETGDNSLLVYAFHRHMHEHKQMKRGFLTFCRDIDEVRDWQLWAKEMEREVGPNARQPSKYREVQRTAALPHIPQDAVDDMLASYGVCEGVVLGVPPRGGYKDVGINIVEDKHKDGTSEQEKTKPSHSLEPNKSSLQNQVRLWHTHADGRKERIEKTRATWKEIQKERERERRQILWENCRKDLLSICKGDVKKTFEKIKERKAEWDAMKAEQDKEEAEKKKAMKHEEMKKRTWKTRPPGINDPWC